MGMNLNFVLRKRGDCCVEQKGFLSEGLWEQDLTAVERLVYGHFLPL
jgi:hypothetical protein